MITKIVVETKKEADVRGASIKEEIKRVLGITSITQVQAIKVYRLQGWDTQTATQFAQSVLLDPLSQACQINSQHKTIATKQIEIGKRPGVMNPEIATLFKAARDLRLPDLEAVDTSWQYHFYGDITDEQVDLICNRILANHTIEHIINHEPESLIINGQPGIIDHHALRTMNDQQLKELSQSHQLYLTILEMRTIQHYFIQLGRDPSDAELETIAQTWSEHCCHKTFKAPLIINGVEKKSLFSRLKETSAVHAHETVSAFIDNAGAFSFYDGYAILGKVETHNSPSAIEPYGGAATGSSGVFRDIMATGQGAQVIASTDMFCFAPPNLPAQELPSGCLAPDYLLRNVVAGVRDYGNRMGIPTNNGSVHFHKDFRAKPTVIVGAYGIAPENKCKKGTPQPGDYIIVIGGRTGRDGIHGATFSSTQMTASTISINANAVQIGNAIEQKRMTDALLVARDKNLIRAITDCGAGGFSSAIGEMAHPIGAHVTLEKAPLKYVGLNPWEIWVSESQERMVCAIAPEHMHEFNMICAHYNVEATHIGIFTNTKKLVVTYYDESVCNLDLDFLHNGMPLQPLTATYAPKKYKDPHAIAMPTDWVSLYKKILADWNICSKEPIVRQYDHGVQGTNVLPPFSGTTYQGPNDATVLTPLLGKPYGLIISHGMNPILNRCDAYAGSWWAIIEALANLVAVGGNYADTYLIDNFIWPCPDQTTLGQLDASLQACVDAMNLFKIPFISGKDSLSSTYRYADGSVLQIPPVLCISAMSKIPDVAKTVTSDFKQEGSLIILLGQLDSYALGGSAYLAAINQEEITDYHVPTMDKQKLPTLFATVHSLINRGIIQACHDISEGGIAVTLAEMCFGGTIGAHIDLSFLKDTRTDFFLFNETAGCFLIEVAQKDFDAALFADIDYQILGTTTAEQTIIIVQNNQPCIKVTTAELLSSWQRPIKEIFNS